ncbi:hypothetical protein PENSUB_11265 [Penicillium subrubescens]|uniref:Uncharacterized protein n=1 Tax=Penicillium subrubescens TaxID=1316194 RepID=A0A1Q5T4N3_9EURO|nr:hypothetical protein PENSUB_11265 [Penicillium subrubescens]
MVLDNKLELEHIHVDDVGGGDSPVIYTAAKELKVVRNTIMYLGALNTGYATSFFTPSILRDMGWTSLMAQVMSIPIYVVAAIMTLCTAILSQETKRAR